jgi:hypothetical protein
LPPTPPPKSKPSITITESESTETVTAKESVSPLVTPYDQVARIWQNGYFSEHADPHISYALYFSQPLGFILPPHISLAQSETNANQHDNGGSVVACPKVSQPKHVRFLQKLDQSNTIFNYLFNEPKFCSEFGQQVVPSPIRLPHSPHEIVA